MNLMWPVLIIGLDQVSKWWAMTQGLVVLNYGGVWGIFPGTVWTLMVGLLLAVLSGWWYREGDYYLGLILAAGMSNFIDRLFYGAVRDFIYYPGLNVYGNIADVILLIGVGGWLWRRWRLSSKTRT